MWLPVERVMAGCSPPCVVWSCMPCSSSVGPHERSTSLNTSKLDQQLHPTPTSFNNTIGSPWLMCSHFSQELAFQMFLHNQVSVKITPTIATLPQGRGGMEMVDEKQMHPSPPNVKLTRLQLANLKKEKEKAKQNQQMNSHDT